MYGCLLEPSAKILEDLDDQESKDCKVNDTKGAQGCFAIPPSAKKESSSLVTQRRKEFGMT